PVLGEPRLRGARREQPRLERLRQNILQGRRSEARSGTAVGLRRSEEISSVTRLRGREEDRDHGWLLRRLHGPGGAGLQAGGIQRRSRYLRCLELGPNAPKHSALLGIAAEIALCGDRRSEYADGYVARDLAALPRRQD